MVYYKSNQILKSEEWLSLVESNGPENRQAGNRLVGSNPTSSAIYK